MGISWNCNGIIIIIIIIIINININIKPLLPFMYSSPELFQVFLIKFSKNVSHRFEWHNDVISHTELLKLFATLGGITTTLAMTTERMVKTSLIKIWSINHNSVMVSLPVCVIHFWSYSRNFERDDILWDTENVRKPTGEYTGSLALNDLYHWDTSNYVTLCHMTKGTDLTMTYS